MALVTPGQSVDTILSTYPPAHATPAGLFAVYLADLIDDDGLSDAATETASRAIATAIDAAITNPTRLEQ